MLPDFPAVFSIHRHCRYSHEHLELPRGIIVALHFGVCDFFMEMIDRCSSFAIPRCDFAYQMGSVGVIAYGKQRMENKELVEGVLDGMEIPRKYYAPTDGQVLCKDCQRGNTFYYPRSIVMYQ